MTEATAAKPVTAVQAVEDDVATRRILNKYADARGDADERAVVWLALAFTQSKVGRLDPAVRDEALRSSRRVPTSALGRPRSSQATRRGAREGQGTARRAAAGTEASAATKET